MRYVVLCDFDGTITMKDISVVVLEKFGQVGWRQYEDLLETNEITVEQCLELEFAHVKESKMIILNKVKDFIEIREGFKEFVQFCHNQGLEIIILSAGLDFIIQHVQQILEINLSVVVPSTGSGAGINFTFPEKLYPDSKDFKADLVKKYQNGGYTVVFIGDGGSDYQGAKLAEHVFAVENKSLSKFLSKSSQNQLYLFKSFETVTRTLQSIMQQ